MTTDDEFLFADEDDHAGEPAAPEGRLHKPWKILIVDDEPSIHDVTRLALKAIRFQHRDCQLLHAYSADECIKLLAEHTDIALVLLDVVMENDHAGLDAVKRIRGELGNRFVRIILRTGQPGQAPEHEVILNYDINDYKEKTELTEKKLYTTVISALRSYEDIVAIEKSRQGLEKIIHAVSNVFIEENVDALFSGILMQVLSLLNLNDDDFRKSTSSFIIVFNDSEQPDELPQMPIFSATGRFEPHTGSQLASVVATHTIELLQKALHEEANLFALDQFIVYMQKYSLIFIETQKELDEIDQKLLDLFCSNVCLAYENRRQANLSSGN